MTMAGPSGTSSMSSCQTIGGRFHLPAIAVTAVAASLQGRERLPLQLAQGALISIRCTVAASRNPGTVRAARSASRISVPRPGPSSMRRSGAGRPMPCQTTAHHKPISSPNTWLISGAVTKSPAAPMLPARCQ